MSDIATCLNCAAKNRLKPSTDQLPVCGKCGNTLPWLVQASETSFNVEVDAAVPVLVDFWAAWCGPCRMIAPVLEDLSKELAGKLKIVKVNVDDNRQIAATYKAQSIPMLMVFKQGEAIDTFVGALPKGALLERLRPHL
ncbi:MAG: thioredoxin [Deinococcota bacterium]